MVDGPALKPKSPRSRKMVDDFKKILVAYFGDLETEFDQLDYLPEISVPIERGRPVTDMVYTACALDLWRSTRR